MQRSVDGVMHRPAQFERHATMQPSTAMPELPAKRLAPRTALTRPFQITPQPARRATVWDRLQLPVLLMSGIVAGFLAQALWFGVGGIAIYGIASVIFHIPSRVSFMLSFMALTTVIVLLVGVPNVALAGNFATYTFLLLVIGVIALAVEARPPKRRKRPRNR